MAYCCICNVDRTYYYIPSARIDRVISTWKQPPHGCHQMSVSRDKVQPYNRLTANCKRPSCRVKKCWSHIYLLNSHLTAAHRLPSHGTIHILRTTVSQLYANPHPVEENACYIYPETPASQPFSYGIFWR